ncbi:hypothetical protein X566_08755 [Afipia sp. P52-10]|nr:hypothetical protein X566_08755 [Afipia sp. P52-10]
MRERETAAMTFLPKRVARYNDLKRHGVKSE